MHAKSTNPPISPAWLWVFGWALLVGCAMLMWPIWPIDETRYTSVAWDMWLRGEYLVPHINGEPYSHKPPLLFWLLNAGWWLFGVNEWSPRLISALASAGSLMLTRVIAGRLWPQYPDVARYAPLFVLGCLPWALFTPAIMFDLLLALWVLVAIYGALRVLDGRGAPGGWLLVGAAIGLGILTKGPVILLHVLLPLALAPLWAGATQVSWRAWYAGLLGSVLLGALIALAWALPAAAQGGEEYAQAIFWGQSAGRMVKSFAHARPWWWYLALLPVVLFPWSLWPPLWRALWRLFRGEVHGAERGLRLGVAWILPVFAAFSLVSGKQVHYLLPELPAAGMLFARALHTTSATPRPWLLGVLLIAAGAGLTALWGLADGAPRIGHLELDPLLIAIPPIMGAAVLLLARFRTGIRAVASLHLVSILVVVTISVAVLAGDWTAFDPRALAKQVAAFQRAGAPVAFVGEYQAQLHFLGRLREPFATFDWPDAGDWVAAHPDGAVIIVFSGAPPTAAPPILRSVYRGEHIGLWSAAAIGAYPILPE